MTTIRQLLREKGDKVISVRPADLVYDAIRKMAEENIGSLVVMEARHSRASLQNDNMPGMLP
jgi:CBS domain-containing protein